MGDPLVHPELGHFLDTCHSHEVRVFLVTNGVLLKAGGIERLLHPALRQVNFSLHSFRDNYGDKDPTDYLENIFQFTERALRDRPDLYINYRLWNLKEVRGSLQSSSDILRRIEKRFGVNISHQHDVGRHKGRRLLGRLYLHFDTEFVWPAMNLPTLGETGFCYGLNNHFGILVDGSVVPCCLDKEGVVTLGNIHTQSIEAILNSPRARRMTHGFAQRQLIEPLCQRCSYIERFRKKTTLPVLASVV